MGYLKAWQNMKLTNNFLYFSSSARSLQPFIIVEKLVKALETAVNGTVIVLQTESRN